MASNSDEDETHENEVECEELVEETFKMHCEVFLNGTGTVEFKLAPYWNLSDFVSSESNGSTPEYWDILAEILDVEGKEEVVDHFRERTDLRRRDTVAYILVDAETGKYCFNHLHDS